VSGRRRGSEWSRRGLGGERKGLKIKEVEGGAKERKGKRRAPQ